MKILHLTLKKKWFDMIASGEKTEEYREIKPYWWKRLVTGLSLEAWAASPGPDPDFIPYTHVRLQHGYKKYAPYILAKIDDIRFDLPEPGWCEPEDEEDLFFVIVIGKIILKYVTV